MKRDIKIEAITPKIALQYLKKNYGNRPLRKRTTNSYARQMKNKEWEFCGDTIVFDTNGKLRNGQHRLNAVVESGVPMETIVVRGVRPQAFAFMDANAPRRAGDALSIIGMPEGRQIETAIRMIMGIHNNIRGVGVGPKLRWHAEASRAEIMNFAKTWQNELNSITKFVAEDLQAKQSLGASKATLIALLFCIENAFLVDKDKDGEVVDEYFVSASKKTSNKAREFMQHFVRGDGLNSDSPILKLRQRLLASITHAKQRLSPPRKAILIAHAWNAFVGGYSQPKWFGSKVNAWPDIIWPEDIQ